MSEEKGPRRLLLVLPEAPDAAADGAAWAEGLAEQGDEVTVVLTGPRPRLGAGIRSVDLSGLGPVRTVRSLGVGLRRLRPDAVVSIGTACNVATLLAARGTPTPVLIVERDLLTGRSDGHGSSPMRAAKRLYRRAHAAASASHAVAAELSAAFGLAPSRSLMVPLPILAARETVRRTASEDGTLRIVLPSVSPQSRPHVAVEAARVLSRRGIEVEILAAAWDAPGADLRDMAQRMGVSLRDAPEAAIGAAVEPGSVVLDATALHGFPTMLVHAAAQGIPSVALSSALGPAEAMVVGVTGELSLDDDPNAVADALQAARHLSIPDVSHWLDRFTVRSSTAQLSDAIDYARRAQA